MAVLAQRLQPTSALLDALDDGWPRDLREALGSNEGGPTGEVLLWMYPMLVLYIGLMCTAWALDQRTRYTTSVPHWAQQGALGFTLWRQFLFHARTQMVLLRPFHVVADRTAYTTVRPAPLFTQIGALRIQLVALYDAPGAKCAHDFHLCYTELPGLTPLLTRAAVLRARNMCAPLRPSIDLYPARQCLPTAHTGLPHSPRALQTRPRPLLG